MTMADISHSNHAFQMDVSSSESVSIALSEILARYPKPPSVVVNAAGITKDNFLLKMTESEFDDVINVNLKVISTTRIALN